MGQVIRLCWKHAVFLEKSPFLKLLLLPEGTHDQGMPVSSLTTGTVQRWPGGSESVRMFVSSLGMATTSQHSPSFASASQFVSFYMLI